jgi:hypothetical protein
VTRLRQLTALSLLMGCIAVAALAHAAFRAPHVTTVTDAYLPYEMVFDGFVVLDVSLDKRGEVIGTEALRDPGAMVPAAVTSVRTWKVRPSMLGSAAIASEMTAVFVYRPRPNGPALPLPPKDFKPVLPYPGPHIDEAIDYVPAGIISVAYPDYPVNAVAWGFRHRSAYGQLRGPDREYGSPTWNGTVHRPRHGCAAKLAFSAGYPAWRASLLAASHRVHFPDTLIIALTPCGQCPP